MADKDTKVFELKPVKAKNDPFDSSLTKVAKEAIDNSKMKRSTEDLFKKAQEMNVDPFEILLNIADGNKLALDLDDESDKPISPELRAMAAREVLKYMYPTMKSAEISGPGGEPLPPQVVKILFEGEDKEEPITSKDPGNGQQTEPNK